MKKILTTLSIILGVFATVHALTVFFPVQGGTGTSTIPNLGDVLVGQTNGTYAPQATSSLGIQGGTGVTNAYASSTFPSFTYGSSTYYFASNPSGYITNSALSGYVQFVYASSTFPSFTYGSSTYYLATNPSGYITNTVSNLTNYPTLTYGSSTYYLATNPSGYITNSALTSYVPYTYGSSTYYFASNPSGYITNTVNNLTNYPTYTYASSTHPSFGYGSSTYATQSSLGSYVTYTYGTGTYATIANYPSNTYASSTFVTYPYASSTFADLVSNQTIGGNKSFTGTTNLTNFTASNATTSSLVANSYIWLKGMLDDSISASGTAGQVLTSTGTSTLWQTFSSSGVTNAYASSTFPSFTYASSTYVDVVSNQTVAGNKSFTGNTSMTNASTTNLTITGSLFDSIASRGSYGNVLWSTGTSTQWVATSSLGITGGGGGVSGGTTGKVATWASPTSLTSGTLIDNGIVSGVNATSSSYTFNVQGSSGINPLNVASSSGTAYMTILSNGNVGLGTSSPSSLLSVNGDIFGTSTLTLGAGTVPSAVPSFTMTSANTPTPYVITASSEYNATYAGWKAFDGNATTEWATLGVTSNFWVSVDLGAAYYADSAYVLGRSSGEVPNNWRIDGSNDNFTTYTTMYSQASAMSTTGVTITLTTPGTYRYYRMYAVTGSGTNPGMATFTLSTATLPPASIVKINGASGVSYFNTGNVGIGMSSPGSKLVIKGLTSDNTASALNVTDSGGNSKFFVRNDGNIGIASTSPVYTVSLSSGAGYGSIISAENVLATSTTMTINWQSGNEQLVRLGTAATTLTMSNYQAGATEKLIVCNPPNATAGAITFSPAIYWPSGTVPTQTTTANHCDVWDFVASNATSSLIIMGKQTANY